jgi:hypothetical protein
VIKRYGLICLYGAVVLFMTVCINACAKKDTVNIPEQRAPIILPEIDEEDIYDGIDIEEVDTAEPPTDQDLLNDEERQ